MFQTWIVYCSRHYGICFRYVSLNLLHTNPSKLLSCPFSDVTCLPYVLPQQVFRVYRHGEIKQFWSHLWSRIVNNIFFLVFISVLLHCSKKVQSSVIASCRSPWYHADVGVAWSQVSRQWPFLILWPSQHVCSHSHVLLLHDVCHGTSISKVCTALCDYVNTFATDLWRVYWLRYQPPKEMLLLKSQIKSFLFMKFWFVAKIQILQNLMFLPHFGQNKSRESRANKTI